MASMSLVLLPPPCAAAAAAAAYVRAAPLHDWMLSFYYAAVAIAANVTASWELDGDGWCRCPTA